MEWILRDVLAYPELSAGDSRGRVCPARATPPVALRPQCATVVITKVHQLRKGGH